MTRRQWVTAQRLVDRIYAAVTNRMKGWGSTGWRDAAAPQAVQDWWQQWFAAGELKLNGAGYRVLMQRYRDLESAQAQLPAASWCCQHSPTP